MAFAVDEERGRAGDAAQVRTAHVIALGINRHRQVDDGLGGAEQGAGPQRFGQ